jgi:hypothetical protein
MNGFYATQAYALKRKTLYTQLARRLSVRFRVTGYCMSAFHLGKHCMI